MSIARIPYFVQGVWNTHWIEEEPMTIPTIPLWFVAGIAAIWAALVLWKLFGERALTRSRDAGKLERLMAVESKRLAKPARALRRSLTRRWSRYV